MRKAVDKAKVPALAVGAGLAGVVGGIVLKGRQQSRNGVLGKLPKPSVPSVSLPKPNGSMAKVVGGAAKGIGQGAYQLGRLTNEVQQVREALESDKQKK